MWRLQTPRLQLPPQPQTPSVPVALTPYQMKMLSIPSRSLLTATPLHTPNPKPLHFLNSTQPIIGDAATDMQYRDAADLLGVTLREMVALHGRVRSASLARLQGYNGSWSHAAAAFGNQFYVTLLTETWRKVVLGDVVQFKAEGKDM
jgi:hypothetical protein